LESVKEQQIHGLEALPEESEKLRGLFLWCAVSATVLQKKSGRPAIGCPVVWAVVLVEEKEPKMVGGGSC
jgi:hypothetical protein